MKRLLFVLIAFVFILAACGNNSSKDKEASKDSKTITLTLQIYVYVSRGSYGIAAAMSAILTLMTVVSLLIFTSSHFYFLILS